MEACSTARNVVRRINAVASHLKRPTMRTTYQLAAKLGPKEEQGSDDVWTDATKSIIGWVRARCGSELPQEAWEGNDFECGFPGHEEVECVTIPSEGLWSLRFTHPDAPHGNQEAVPGRTWTTELALKRGDSATHQFGVRLFCTSQPYCDAEIDFTRPGIVPTLADRFTLSTLRQLDGTPWYLNRGDDLDEFHDFITDPQRVLPVYLLTEADATRLPGRVRQYVLDERSLAKKTLGLAHVAVLPRAPSFQWTDRVGKVWSAFQGAVRTYRPGLNFDTDSPFADHPLALAENIVLTRYRSDEGEGAFATFITDKSYHDSATRAVDWQGCLFFTDAKRLRAEIVRHQAREGADWEAIYQDEIAILERKIEEIEEQYDQMMDLVDRADKDRDYYIAENNNLRWQNDWLRVRLTEKTGANPDTEIEIPQSYDDLPDWVSTNLSGRLVLHPRAIRAVQDARYEKVELVYRVLLLLAQEYRDKKLGRDGAQDAFDTQRKNLKVEDSPSISRERAGEEGDTYFVQYPNHTTSKCFLERHICKGTTRDDRYCLRVYFFWDNDTGQVVVGWLPSHLENRLT